MNTIKASAVAAAVATLFAGADASAQQSSQQQAPKATAAQPANPNANQPSATGAQTTTPGGAVTGAGQAQIDGKARVEAGAGLEGRAVRADREGTDAKATRHTQARGDADARDVWERTHRASKIIGTNVYNRQGEKLGDIKDIVLDPGNASIRYAVVSVGGFLGIGEKLVAVPWKTLQTDPQRKAFMMDATKDRLEQAKGFDDKNWPNMADAKWNADTQTFYGQQGRGETGARGATSTRGAGSGSGPAAPAR